MKTSLLSLAAQFAFAVPLSAEDAYVAVPAPLPRPAEGYWQPGGYAGRIGSPYFYSVYGYRGYARRVAGPRFEGGCACGAGGRHRGWAHAAPAYRPGAWYGGIGARDPYTYHFGPGYYRYAEHGHFRFPYYSYRRPWYYPGQPVFNRDTNFAW